MSTQIQFDDKHKLIMIHSRPEEMMGEWLQQFTDSFSREYPSYRVLHVPYGEPVKDDLRDQFAMAALTGNLQFFADHDVTDFREIATDCYNMADAMLKARGSDE